MVETATGLPIAPVVVVAAKEVAAKAASRAARKVEASTLVVVAAKEVAARAAVTRVVATLAAALVVAREARTRTELLVE